jgi:NhaP-type Na+/H+ or K+/H+ antiporter
MLKLSDWLFLLLLSAGLTVWSNYIGYHVAPLESIPGVLILSGIGLAGYLLSKIIPLRLPFIMYVSLMGLLLASPWSPVGSWVVEYTSKVNFLAPAAAVGILSGIGMGKDFKEFKRQGWKMIVIGVLVITGTYIGSVVVAHVVLKMTGAI